MFAERLKMLKDTLRKFPEKIIRKFIKSSSVHHLGGEPKVIAIVVEGRHCFVPRRTDEPRRWVSLLHPSGQIGMVPVEDRVQLPLPGHEVRIHAHVVDARVLLQQEPRGEPLLDADLRDTQREPGEIDLVALGQNAYPACFIKNP